MARPEAPAFLTALVAVAVGTGTTVVFPFAIGKCMDAMTLGGGKQGQRKEEEGLADITEGGATVSNVGPDFIMNAREFLEASFGQGNIPTWLLEVIPPDAAPLSVLSAGLVGVSRCMF